MPWRVLDVLSRESFWLPPNITWEDITNGPDKEFVYTEMWDLWYQIPISLFILALRVLMTKVVFIPLGKTLGVPEKIIRPIPSYPMLEAAYKSTHKLTNTSMLAKKLDITERQVERWFRLRRNQDKLSKMDKFCETSWKTIILFASVSFGLYNVWDKDWFWDVEKFLINYPHQSLTQGEWWYIMLNTSFYWTLLITHFSEARRKDFWPMFMHHIITILLLIVSWRFDVYKLCMVILPLQDSSELLLQLTKTIHYTRLPWLSQYIAFVVFVVWWAVERLYIYPVKFVWVLLTGVVKLYGLFPMAVIGLAALFILMALQLWWTWLIVVLIYNTLAGKPLRDVRSSESEISESVNEDFIDKVEFKKATERNTTI